MKVHTRSDTVEFRNGKAILNLPERPHVRRVIMQEEEGDGQAYKCALTGAWFAAKGSLFTLRLEYQDDGEAWEFAVCPQIACSGDAALRWGIEQAIENRVLEAAMRLVNALDLHQALRTSFQVGCPLCKGAHGFNTQCQRPAVVCPKGSQPL